MVDMVCNLCGENKNEDNGVKFNNNESFECNDCHVGDCGKCEQPVFGGEKAPDVYPCVNCGVYLHKACVTKGVIDGKEVDFCTECQWV